VQGVSNELLVVLEIYIQAHEPQAGQRLEVLPPLRATPKLCGVPYHDPSATQQIRQVGSIGQSEEYE
jgi:hypothetical protein